MQLTRSIVLASILSLIALTPFGVTAQDKSHVTPERVDMAIREIEKLAQKEIQENAVPGLLLQSCFETS